MNEPYQIRVMTVDDHEILRGGIKFLLLAFDDLILVGEASGGKQAIELCKQVKPDVILMDIMMPGMDGVATTQAIRREFPHAQIIILTSFPEEDLVRRAMQAGAIGYLLKGVPIDELAGAIRSAYAGKPILSAEAAQALIHAANPKSKPGYDLTERQQDVLALIVQGYSNIEIAEKLVLSPSTVRHHVSEILSKLGASNRAEAAVQAVKNGLVK